MTARWVALGWAWCLSLGLIGMISVSGWAFIGHIQTSGGGGEESGSTPGKGDGTRSSIALSAPDAPAPQIGRAHV